MSSIGLSRSLSPFQLSCLRIATMLGCLLSFSFTMRFVGHYRSDIDHVTVYAVGVFWELCKYWPAFLGCVLLMQDTLRAQIVGFILCAVSAIVIIGSFCASLGAIGEIEQQAQHQDVASTLQHQTLRQSIAAVEKQIALQETSADQYNAFKDPKSSVLTNKGISALLDRKNSMVDALTRLETSSGVVVGRTFVDAVADLINGAPLSLAEKVKIYANVFITFVIDIVSALGCFFWHGTRSNASQNASSTPEIKRINFEARKKRDEEEDAEGRGDTSIASNGKNTRYARAKEMISEQAVAPTYRKLQDALDLSSRTAKRFLNAMVEEGFLRRNGNRYEVKA